MSYAAQFPDLFTAALSFSGAPDISYDPLAFLGAQVVVNATELFLDRVPVDSMFGNPVTDRVNWAAHDPATLAPNLRGMALLLFNGNGAPGPYDTAPDPGASAIEALVAADTAMFHQRLVSLGIPSLWDAYGPGTHSWPYWARDLRQSIGIVMARFAHPPPPPAAVTYTSAAPSYDEFGWQVGVDRPAPAFSTLTGARAGGFALSGDGTAVVVTPPLYRPGAPYRIVTRGGAGAGAGTAVVTADALGRLHVPVPLAAPAPGRCGPPTALTGVGDCPVTTVRIVPR